MIEIEVYVDLRDVAVLDLLQEVARILLVQLIEVAAEVVQGSLIDHLFLDWAGCLLYCLLSVRSPFLHLSFEDSVLSKVENAATSRQVVPRFLRVRLRNVNVHHRHVLGSDVALKDCRRGYHICAGDWLLLPALEIVEVFTVDTSENVTDLLDISQVLRRP